MLPDDLLGHVVDQGSAVDVGGGVKGAVVQALLDDLPDGGLREGPGVDLLVLMGGGLLPPGQYRLHLHLDQEVVGHLADRVRHHRVGDPDVSRPELIQLVALLVGHGPLSQCRGESKKYNISPEDLFSFEIMILAIIVGCR